MSLLLYAIEGISSSADDDQRHAALDPRHLLKKVAGYGAAPRRIPRRFPRAHPHAFHTKKGTHT